MRRFFRLLNCGAAVLFGVVAAATTPAQGTQVGSCNDRGSIACSVTTEWECEVWGVCAVLPPGHWFGCCWEGRITRDYDYYDNS